MTRLLLLLVLGASGWSVPAQRPAPEPPPDRCAICPDCPECNPYPTVPVCVPWIRICI